MQRVNSKKCGAGVELRQEELPNKSKVQAVKRGLKMMCHPVEPLFLYLTSRLRSCSFCTNNMLASAVHIDKPS